MPARPIESLLPWSLMVDALNTGLIVLNPRGEVLLWNAWVVRHSGIEAQTVLGRTLESVFANGLSLSFISALKNVLTYKLPVVLSNVLHRTPLPLYQRPEDAAKGPQQRMPQSLTLVPVRYDSANADGFLVMLQIADTSSFVKRERVLQSRTEKLSREAVIDGLTGIYNRKYFDQKLAVEVSRAQRQKNPLSLVMLDVDYFKKYNDTYGHPAGDRVLQAVVGSVQSQLNRLTDVFARYGGEEFIIILPSSDQSGATQIAEKVRQAVLALQLDHARSQVAKHITVSLGVATCLGGVVCTETRLLDTVDKALYAAKHGGRNMVQWLSVSDAHSTGGYVVNGQDPPASNFYI
ncbi:GGDEF domain-containing protein [Rhodoferax sp.]|uniref:GGDEF domain-containing protein n=1 Tax=Rhodoferax sp. TaxID=50421 RepID=UPI0025D85A89|nr:diguanylate cyclase [Rhodoferax sp.]